MKIALLSANLNNFDIPVDPVEQTIPSTFHRFTDDNFPPITGLTPRLQYRIPKCFGWQMFPGYDYYLWFDGAMTLEKDNSAEWFLEQLRGSDIAVYKHPWRNSIEEETDHIEEHLKLGKSYITSRYKNGLHKEQLTDIQTNPDYIDDHLYASTAFIYRDTEEVRNALREWWLHQSRYYSCDQLAFTYALRNLSVKVISENPFKASHLKHVSRHK